MDVKAEDIMQGYRELEEARETGDELKIDLATAALNNLLDRYLRPLQLSQVTTEVK